MAVAPTLKDELRRLVDEIPDSRPEVARVMFELLFLLIFTSQRDERLFRLFVREAEAVQKRAESPDELVARLKALRDEWVHGQERGADPVLRALESAPEDDEPLTPEEIAMLDARLASVTRGRTIPDEELVHRLGS